MTDTQTLLLLFEKIAEGDQKSLESLFNLLHKRLLNFITSYIKNKEASEEIVSDVFFRLWQQGDKLLQIEQPEIYLFVCSKNAAIDYIRKYGNNPVVYMEEAGSATLLESTDPLQELENKELKLKMDRAIDSLPLQCKAVFRLVKEQGFKCREVAQIMGISTRTVETQVYKAIKRLDDILMRNEPAPKKVFPVKSSLNFLLQLFF